MTVWDERIAGHGVLSTLDSVRARLEKAKEHLKGHELLEAHARLERGLDFVDRTLSSVDPALVPLGPLNNIQRQLAQVDSHLQQFLNSQQPALLTDQANSQLDGALHAAAQLPVPTASEDVDGLRDDVTRFRKSAGSYLRYLEQEFDAAKKGIEQKLASTQSAIAKTETQIESRLQELNAEKQRLDKAIADFQEQFRSTEAERANKFTESTEQRAEKFRNLLVTSETKLASRLDEMNKTASEFIEHFSQRKQDLEKMFEAAGATALTGGFEKTAKDEGQQANAWRWIGIAGILGIVAVALFVFGPPTGILSWNVISAKFLVSTPLAALAGYALTESAKHRRRQAKNRKMALELASIDPYLALMPEEERHSVKRLLVERWFAQPEVTVPTESASTKSLVELLGEAIRVLGSRT